MREKISFDVVSERILDVVCFGSSVGFVFSLQTCGSISAPPPSPSPSPCSCLLSFARLSSLGLPFFTSIDPVIHYQSKTGKKQKFGRTDLGRKGVREFFKTHECNDVCRLLCLPGARSPEVEAAAKAAKAAAKARRGKRQRMYMP